MLLYRVGPEGFYAVRDEHGALRVLHDDPFETRPAAWELGRALAPDSARAMAPVLPGKLVGIGRSYAEHARELGNAVAGEPVLFLKAPSSVIGPEAPIVLPPESARVEYEGEIALVLHRRLRRARPADALDAVLGITAACDVTARDLQRKDPCFARAKSFDTFCPLGPAVRVVADPGELEGLEVVTRVNGVERQRGRSAQMLWPLAELLAFASRMMTLEPGDVLLTGTPPGVGELADGDVVEVEVSGVPVLRNPVERWRQEQPAADGEDDDAENVELAP